jgi:hypothetical protein
VWKKKKKGEENRRVKKDVGRGKRNDEHGYETMTNSEDMCFRCEEDVCEQTFNQ